MTRNISLFLAATALAGPAFAQIDEVADEGDRAIVVTGEALPAPEGDAAYSRVTVDPEADGRAALRLEQLLGSVAGFQPYRRADTRSSHPTANGLALRGLGGNAASRAPILLDGVPITDPFGGWISWGAVDPASLSRIRIVRSGGLIAAGPGALSGLVSLSSKTEAGREGELSYGSRDSLTARGLISTPLGGGAGMVAARYDRGDGFIPVVKGQRGPVDRASPYESFSVRARGIVPLAGGELQAGIGGFSDRRERGTPYSDNDQTGGQASLRFVREGPWAVEALAYATVREFDTGFARIDDAPGNPRSVASQALDQSTDATGLGGKIELRPPLPDGYGLRFGADFENVDGTTRELASFAAGAPRIAREAGGTNRNLGLYVEGDWQASAALLLTAGLRGDFHQRRDGRLIERDIGGGTPVPAVIAPDRDDEYFSARVGARLDLGSGLAARAAAYRSYREPTLNELYRPYRVGADGVAANPDLDAERLTGGEVGFDWASADERWSASATAFYARLDNAISNVTLGVSDVGPFDCPGVGDVYGACQQRQNVDAIRSKGLELDAAFAGARFGARLSVALTDAEVEASGAAAALDGKRPAQVPEAAVALALDWHPVDALGLFANVEWQGNRYEDDLETQRLDSFARVDLGADYALTDTVRVGLSAENVFDARIETGVSGDGIYERSSPRTLWATLRFTQ